MPLSAYGSRELVRHPAVTRQQPAARFGFYAHEMLGRAPWKGVGGRVEDGRLVKLAMERAQATCSRRSTSCPRAT
ncbi:MAG: hypothetical protein QOI45_756 [Thermoleophilaceae bacterium]|nr:hypothetical protein [Thermoleophilaceae bacterium]